MGPLPIAVGLRLDGLLLQFVRVVGRVDAHVLGAAPLEFGEQRAEPVRMFVVDGDGAGLLRRGCSRLAVLGWHVDLLMSNSFPVLLFPLSCGCSRVGE